MQCHCDEHKLKSWVWGGGYFFHCWLSERSQVFFMSKQNLCTKEVKLWGWEKTDNNHVLSKLQQYHSDPNCITISSHFSTQKCSRKFCFWWAEVTAIHTSFILFLRIKWKWQRKQTAVTKNRNKQFIFQISIHLTVCSKAMPIACQNMVMRVFTCHGTYITCYEGCWPSSRVTNLPQKLPWGLLIKKWGLLLKTEGY